MSNLGIGRYGMQPYNRSVVGKNTVSGHTSSPCGTSNITLNYTDKATGNKATNCIGLPNGSSASVFRSEQYSADADENGFESNAFSNFNYATLDSDGNMNYDANSIHSKNNFKALIADYMDMQYQANNYVGYLSYKRFYEWLIFDCFR